MRIIIGLGNPGKKYENTRHNAGFSCLEFIRKAWEFPPFRDDDSFQSECSEGRIGDEKILLARPIAFMNRSGEVTRNLVNFYKVELKHLAVIHDDLDIPLGDVRESFGSRSAGHLGVEDIIERLGAKDFFRFRIGIKRRETESEGAPLRDAADFVLEPFSADERALVEKTFPTIVARLRSWKEK